MNLDIRTVLITGATIEAVCALVIGLLWRQNRHRYDGIGFWVTNFSWQAIGQLLVILRSGLPVWMSVVLANTLALAGTILGLLGLERFVGRRGPQVQNYVLLSLFPLVQVYLTFVRPDVAARSLTMSVIQLFVCGQCAWLMLRRVAPAMRPLTREAGWVFLAFCLACAYRIGLYVLHPRRGGDLFHMPVARTAEAVVHLVLQILFVLITYSMALMVNRRLLRAIQTEEEKFAKAFQSSPYAITLTDLAVGRILEANESFFRISGHHRDEVRGKTIADLRLWAQDADRARIVGALTERGRILGMELPLRRKSGECITGLYSAEIVTIDGKKCVLASVNDISERKRAEIEREKLVAERERALLEVRTLSGMLPICASCKKIRDDKGYWNQIEFYLRDHTDATFSHGLCPDCLAKFTAEACPGSAPPA
ncbi:MAG TPA: PAS domain S-box protein [Candidatus Aminicenantes bacterium]|nr:PAS domain S-box protein [Candidatus Aminicenantes bacterium]